MKAEEAYNNLEKEVNLEKNSILKDNTEINLNDLLSYNNSKAKHLFEGFLKIKETYYDNLVSYTDEECSKYNKKALELICDSIKEKKK